LNEQVYSGFLYIMYMCIFWALRDLDLNSYLLFFFLHAFYSTGLRQRGDTHLNAPPSEDSTLLIAASKSG
jgi:hypothetical protein